MSAGNPYEAPKAELDTGLRSAEDLPNASLGARFLNMIIDAIAARIFVTVLAVAVLQVAGAHSESAAVVAGVLALVGFFAYYVVLEATFGWTLGKLITGTRVIRFDGDKPRVPQIIGRTFARFVPFEPFSVLFGSTTLGWHDSWSGTRVVKVRR
jgi:uncharacterized RDD family membrane protein YckC